MGWMPGFTSNPAVGDCRAEEPRVLLQPVAQLRAPRRAGPGRPASSPPPWAPGSWRRGTACSAGAGARRSPGAPRCSRPWRRQAPCRRWWRSTSTRPVHAEVLRRAAAGPADEAGGVAVVHHDQRSMALREGADLGKLRESPSMEKTPSVTIMRTAERGRLAQPAPPGPPCPVRVDEPPRLAQARAVDDGGVVELVGDEGAVLVQERLEDAAVGVEAGGVEDGVLRARGTRDMRCLQLLVDLLRAADEAHGRHPVSPAVQRRVRRLRSRAGCEARPR